MKFWGLAQFVAEKFDKRDTSDDTLEFGEDRVRFGAKMKWDRWLGALQFGANANNNSTNEASLSPFIRDAYAAYRFGDSLLLKNGAVQNSGRNGLQYEWRKIAVVA